MEPIHPLWTEPAIPNQPIQERSRTTPLRKRCDVLVAGGGIAGISAALAAARTGVHVILVEKQCALGGLATLGNITVYLPLCDGMGRQVIFGIAEELLRLSIRHGWEARYPKPWLEGGTLEEKCRTRFQVQYNPWLFALLTEELLLQEGVEILFDTHLVDVHQPSEDRRVDAVILQDREGRWAIETESVVDATGDAELLLMAGEETATHTENRYAAWHYQYGSNGLNLKMHADPLYGSLPPEGRTYDGTKTEDVNALIQDGHRKILEQILTERGNTGELNLVPTSLPLVPSVRMTRRLKSNRELDESECSCHFEDSIGITGDWRKAGPVFEIPFSTLFGRIPNLITAGRSISATTAMWDITRVIPTCAVTGEAAGTAAGLLCLDKSASFETVPINRLQGVLRKNGVRIHLDELEAIDGCTQTD